MARKLVCGVGINDADYVIRDKITKRLCPFYDVWASMLKRCYSTSMSQRQPWYNGCSVDKEWLTFSNFRSWMITQNYVGRQLDKDFLFENNKVYSAKNCVFLPRKLNNFIIKVQRGPSDLPLGVTYHKISGEFRARVIDGKKRVHLGLYKNPLEAHRAYLKHKLKITEKYLIEYKDETLIVQGLTRVRDKLHKSIEENLIIGYI